jgi:hypothetical protein
MDTGQALVSAAKVVAGATGKVRPARSGLDLDFQLGAFRGPKT